MGSSVAVPQHKIDKTAFQSPVGNQANNWSQGMNNMLGATTGSAPQAKNTQLGATQTYGGANIGPTATYGGATLDSGQYNQTFGQEQALANQLGMQAQGLGPSVAQVTAQQQAEKNVASQMAMLGSARGSSNPALAQRAIQDQAVAAQQAAAQQAVLGRTQEALTAQGQQGQLLGAMNQQAQGMAGNQASLQQQAALASMGALNSQQTAQAQLMQQAGLSNQQAYNQAMMQQGQMNQQTAMANLQAALQQGQINVQQYDQYMAQLAAMTQAQYQGNISGEQLAVNQQLGLGNIAIGQAAQSSQNTGSVVQGIGSGLAAAAMAFSDKRVKTNIKSGEKELSDFLDKINKSKAFKLIL